MAIETPAHIRWEDEKLTFGSSAASSLNDHPTLSLSKAKIMTDEINQTLCKDHLLSEEYLEKIKELNDKLDLVKNIVRPGCSYQVLNTALSYISSLATILSEMPQKLHASL